MGKVGDLIIVSFFGTLFFISIIGSGGALSAVYYACVKSVRYEYGIARKEFFHSLRENWVQGFKIVLLFLLYGLATFGSIYFSNQMNMEGYLAMLYWILARMLLLPLFLVLPWIFALLARFTMKTGELIKVSFYIAVRHIGTTILLIFLWAIAAFGICYMPIMTLLIPGVLALASSYLTEKVFQNYTNTTEKEVPF
ncbi:MAG: DUF624 domain-containing protein [Lachnospiraceae bacterium]|nr:DUF624 domain-containing protein [Lachnospiraceae bacterium]